MATFSTSTTNNTTTTKSKRKTPDQIIKLASHALDGLILTLEQQEISEGGSTNVEELKRSHETELCKRLAQLKMLLYGDGDKEEVDENRSNEICQSIQESQLIIRLIEQISTIPFEARKDTAQVFNNLMHKNISNFVDHIRSNSHIVLRLIEGYSSSDTALSCGSMFRECIRYDDLTNQVLQSSQLWLFFTTYVHLPNFEIASDAFNSLRDLFVSSRNKTLAATFIEANYDDFFDKYEILLKSENYVTKRRSLKLLGELLLDRGNFRIMMRYISLETNLQTVMNLLRDTSSSIQFEAFHVFKIFVANPKKTAKIRLILYKNKQKLCQYLKNFHKDKEEEDAQFCEEKKLLIETLSNLEKPKTEELEQEKSFKSPSRPNPGQSQTQMSTTEERVSDSKSSSESNSLENSNNLTTLNVNDEPSNKT